MADLAAQSTGASAKQILVASTGVIGRLLPMAVMESGIPKAGGRIGGGLERGSNAHARIDDRHAHQGGDARLR